MDHYTVALRFEGINLDPDTVSQSLGILPTLSITSGDVPIRRPPLWSFEGSVACAEWESLGLGLEHILSFLGGKEEVVRSLGSAYRGSWWCGFFYSSFDGGPTLKPELLSKLGSFGIPLVLANYYSPDVT